MSQRESGYERIERDCYETPETSLKISKREAIARNANTKDVASMASECDSHIYSPRAYTGKSDAPDTSVAKRCAARPHHDRWARRLAFRIQSVVLAPGIETSKVI